MRDIDIRLALREEIARLHHLELDNTLIVEELCLCQGTARVDLAVVNGSVHGYEIKSEQDTLARLPGQLGVYNRALEFVTIVTAQVHVDKICKAVPGWWGIWSAVPTANGVRLAESRKGSQNPNVDPFALAQLLWREEALQVLDDRGLATGMRSKPRQELWRRLASDLTLREIGSVVRERLKHRGVDWRVPSPRA
jgi:hypothetical protein